MAAEVTTAFSPEENKGHREVATRYQKKTKLTELGTRSRRLCL
jgi:hypothetical protein